MIARATARVARTIHGDVEHGQLGIVRATLAVALAHPGMPWQSNCIPCREDDRGVVSVRSPWHALAVQLSSWQSFTVCMVGMRVLGVGAWQSNRLYSNHSQTLPGGMSRLDKELFPGLHWLRCLGNPCS